MGNKIRQVNREGPAVPQNEPEEEEGETEVDLTLAEACLQGSASPSSSSVTTALAASRLIPVECYSGRDPWAAGGGEVRGQGSRAVGRRQERIEGRGETAREGDLICKVPTLELERLPRNEI